MIKKFNRFKDDFWTADLAKMGFLTSFNHGVKYLVYLIYVCTKYARVKPLKDKKGKTVLHGLTVIVSESKHNPNKLWVNQGRESYDSPMQKWLDNNDISMYLTYNEGKTAVDERFIKTLKGKINKKMTANDSKSHLGYLNKLVDQ